MQRGKRVESRGINLPSVESIIDLDETGYKYLVILELDTNLHEDMKGKVNEAHMKGRRLLFKSKLTPRT